MAFDGTNYLVAWQDYRNGPYADVYGARVNTGGAVLDATGIAISLAANEQLTPAVAFDGYDYLVAWQDKRSASTAPDIYGAKLDTAGTVLDASGIIIAKVGYTQFEPAVSAAPSGQILVAYSSFVLPPVYGSFGIWANFYESHAGVPAGTGSSDAPWLCQNFPNPFASSTAVRFYLPADRRVSVGIYDVRGRLLRTLADGTCPAGMNEIRWDGTSTGGGRAAPGIYFLRLEAGGQEQARKVTLLR
jgi:hypothetical protein